MVYFDSLQAKLEITKQSKAVRYIAKEAKKLKDNILSNLYIHNSERKEVGKEYKQLTKNISIKYKELKRKLSA